MSRQAAAVYDNVTPGCGHEPFSGARRFAHEPNNGLLSLHCRLFHGFEAAFNPPERRASSTIDACATAACNSASQRRGRPLSSSAQRAPCRARAACDPAIAPYDDVAWLLEWLGQDILSAALGPAYAQRSLLYDFMTAELLTRVALCPHRLEPVPRTLNKGRRVPG